MQETANTQKLTEEKEKQKRMGREKQSEKGKENAMRIQTNDVSLMTRRQY